MRIGILTYHRAHNYGAMLQAFALRNVLSSMGHNVSFVDYWPKKHRKEYAPLHFPCYRGDIVSYIADWIVWIMTPMRKIKRYKKFVAFRSEYLNLPDSPKYSEGKNIKENVQLIIYGSDQIWRNYTSDMQHLGFDPVYFGDGIDSHISKIAYAASMGIININEGERNFLQKSLSSFSSLLVREKKLQQLIHELGLYADVVCDPTLLLTKEQWNNLLSKDRYRQEKYLLYYELIPSKQTKDKAKELAAKYGLKLEIITARIHPLYNRHTNQTASPIEFLQAIRDAEFVVCTSFHGTVFSIIFNKQFITMGLGENADRVKTLLKELEIANHYLEYDNLDSTMTEIAYDEVNAKMKIYTDLSIERLKRAIYSIR